MHGAGISRDLVLTGWLGTSGISGAGSTRVKSAAMALLTELGRQPWVADTYGADVAAMARVRATFYADGAPEIAGLRALLDDYLSPLLVTSGALLGSVHADLLNMVKHGSHDLHAEMTTWVQDNTRTVAKDVLVEQAGDRAWLDRLSADDPDILAHVGAEIRLRVVARLVRKKLSAVSSRDDAACLMGVVLRMAVAAVRTQLAGAHVDAAVVAAALELDSMVAATAVAQVEAQGADDPSVRVSWDAPCLDALGRTFAQLVERASVIDGASQPLVADITARARAIFFAPVTDEHLRDAASRLDGQRYSVVDRPPPSNVPDDVWANCVDKAYEYCVRHLAQRLANGVPSDGYRILWKAKRLALDWIRRTPRPTTPPTDWPPADAPDGLYDLLAAIRDELELDLRSRDTTDRWIAETALLLFTPHPDRSPTGVLADGVEGIAAWMSTQPTTVPPGFEADTAAAAVRDCVQAATTRAREENDPS